MASSKEYLDFMLEQPIWKDTYVYAVTEGDWRE